MHPEIEKLKLYIQIKWWLLAATAALIGGEAVFGIVGIVAAGSTFIALALAACLNLLLNSAVRRIKRVPVIAHFTLTFDLLLIILALYFNGGLENTWLFFPVILIFFSGYLFTLRASLFYAAASFLALLAMFALEYYRIIPHFNVYNLPEFYWKNPAYCIDYLIGMFLLYFSGALIIGYFSQLSQKSSEHLRKTMALAVSAKEEAESSRRALFNLMEDLDRAKTELEAKVKQRTLELEMAKSYLEARVAARTADLEQSRKAILHMMKDLKEDIEKLKAVDRIKNEFLSVVSHELRTPLTPIKGYLSLLLSGALGELNDEQKKSLEVINRQSAHLLSLIDGVLDLSRLEMGRPIPIHKEPVSLRTVIGELIEVIKIPAEEKNIKIVADIPELLPTVMADSLKLGRVIINLLGNAIKFTPEKGEIKICSFAGDAQVRVEVIDNGIGIAAENREKIFEKFYQVDSSYTRAAGGIGMGLAIARELVNLHGGRIWVESEGLGKGSKFIFTLPIA